MVGRLQRWMQFGLVGVTAVTLGGPVTVGAQGSVDAGKQLYQMRCTPCHGPDGKANTPTAQALNPKPRDHTDGAYMNALTNEHLAKVIKEGGTAVGKSPLMPPQTDLKDSQVQDLVAYIRALAVPPYSEKK